MAAKREATKYPGIFKRGSRYQYIYRDRHGRQRSGSAATLAEARAAKAAATTDVRRGEHRALSRVSFTEYAPMWITTYRGRTARGVGPVTLGQYRKALGLDDDGKPTADGAVAYFGRMLLTEIGAPELRAYADHVALRPRRRKRRGDDGPLSSTTVRLALAPVKALLATAHEDGLIRSNPAAGLRNLLPADMARAEEVVRAMTDEELAGVLTHLPNRWKLFFGFLAETGVRIGEGVEVRWQDINLGTHWLSVDRSFYRGRVGLPKGQRTRRVRLSERMARELWTLRKQTKATNDALVFTSEKGQRIDQSNTMSRVLKPAAVAAGVGEWVGFHTFRHTCATVLFRSGWNAAQVCRHLGHSDPGFTLRRYVHLLDTDVPEPCILDALSRDSEVATRAAESARDVGLLAEAQPGL
jgi:integrase